MKKRLQRAVSCLMLCALLISGMAAPASAAGFTDVPASHWAASSIQRCVELGFFQGETATRFGLGHQMTRAAFVVVLGRFFGWKTEKVTKSTYGDVPANAWYAGAVEAAYANGAVTLQSGDFRPEDPITREELAVMLVRALGYGNIAGLVQNLPMPFRDVTTNSGYITMAYDLGLVSGTSETAFSPERTATREQVAVILVRLYDKLHRSAPGKVGIAASAAELPDLTGFEAVGMAAGKLLYKEGTVKLAWSVSQEDVEALGAAVSAAGAKQLLYASGTENILRANGSETAKTLAATVEEGGYDGLFLDVEKVSRDGRNSLTALVSALRTELDGRLLYVMAEAPSWKGKTYEGYDYKALAAKADRLVLRVTSYSEKAGDFPTAPVEPLEELYYALGELRDQVDPSRLSLLMTTTGTVWTAGSKNGTASGMEVQELLTKLGVEDYYSNRYACAYLSGTVDRQSTVAWYLDGQAAEARTDLAAFFGVDQICLSQLNGLWPELLDALR